MSIVSSVSRTLSISGTNVEWEMIRDTVATIETARAAAAKKAKDDEDAAAVKAVVEMVAKFEGEIVALNERRAKLDSEGAALVNEVNAAAIGWAERDVAWRERSLDFNKEHAAYKARRAESLHEVLAMLAKMLEMDRLRLLLVR
jgi:hypothetical protein